MKERPEFEVSSQIIGGASCNCLKMDGMDILVFNFILTKIQTVDDNIMMEKRDKWDSDYFSETMLNVLKGDI